MSNASNQRFMTLSYCALQSRHRVVKEIPTFDELRSALIAISKQNSDELGFGVHVNDHTGAGLSIGIADEGGVLIFGDANHTHMAFSIGNPNAEGNVKFYFDQQDELPRRHLIPVDDAMQAIQCWFETGRLSDAVKWDVQPY